MKNFKTTRRRTQESGLIGMIIVIVVGIILLKIWFGIDILKWLMSAEVKDFIFKIWHGIVGIWNKYLEKFFESIFGSIDKVIRSHF